jgi:hypothetical protein
MGFGSLQHLRHRRSACRGRSPTRHVPPSGFGYPLDGLLPSKPCRSCFVPAALLGFALRSLPLSEGNQPFPARKNPRTVHSSIYPCTRGTGAGSTSRGFWALTLPRVPGNRHVFSTPTAGCSLGLSPFRALGRSLGRNFVQPPLTRFFGTTYGAPPAPQSLDQLLLHLTCPTGEPPGIRARHPLRVSAPSRS